MESYINISSISIYFILLLVFILFLRKKSCVNNNNDSSKLPPSPPKLPIIGNIHQLGKILHRSFKTLSDKHGPLILLNLGQVKTLIVSSSEILEEIVEKHDVAFSSRPKTTATEILFYDHKNVIFAPYGDYWKRARSVCVTELLSLKRVKSFHFVREEEAEKLVDVIRKVCPNEEPINLSEALTRASNNVMSRCILGHSYGSREGSIEELGELSNEMSSNLGAFSVGDIFPSLRWFDVLRGFVARLKRGFRAFDKFNDRVVEEHKAARDLRGLDESYTEDFIDVLLRLQSDTGLGLELSHDHVKAILQDMLAAGNDTTSGTLDWLMTELVRNPRVMKKAQEEVRRVVFENDKSKSRQLVEPKDLDRMDYLKQVIKESLRLHPPAPLLAPRETTSRVEIGGYEIPAKTRVFVNAWAIQRDPRLWDRPDEFLPERFDDMCVDFNEKDYKYFPFGFGRRKCPGLALGIVSLEYLVANLLCWFDWKLPNGKFPEDLDMSEIPGLSVRKKEPLYVVPSLYNLDLI